jgi:hypothetical protein
MLRLLSDLTPQRPPEPLSKGSWDDYCKLHSALLTHKALAYAGLGSWDLAGSALGEARTWGGSQTVRAALMMRGGLGSIIADPNTSRAFLGQLAGKDGPAPAMPAAPEPLRLVLLGMPKWLVTWATLSQAPELALWSPGELRWEAASRDLQTRLATRFGWGREPRWALLRGEQLVVTGETCPEAKALATVLEAEGPSHLQRLQHLISSQRDHLAARRERYGQLLKRMPDHRLEATLAQDAARARITLDFDPSAPWHPDPELWAEAAQEVLPRLEEELRSWPSKAALWDTWISWARFHPASPSILTLAQSLAYWEPGKDWRAELPYDVQRAVAAELRRQGSFNAMRDWFRAAWDELDHRPLKDLRRWEVEWVQERRREEETAIYLPLREALQALRCTVEVAELERLFGEMVGRETGRKR